MVSLLNIYKIDLIATGTSPHKEMLYIVAKITNLSAI